MTQDEGIKVVAVNRRVRHDYFILDKYEAGIELTGTEIKSVRASKVELRDGFARVDSGEAWLENVYIAPYDQGNRYNVEPRRRRRLLLHRAEIDRIMGRTQQRGLTMVPLRMYLKHRRAKIELASVKGKRQYDKRVALAEREALRSMEQELGRRR